MTTENKASRLCQYRLDKLPSESDCVHIAAPADYIWLGSLVAEPGTQCKPHPVAWQTSHLRLSCHLTFSYHPTLISPTPSQPGPHMVQLGMLLSVVQATNLQQGPEQITLSHSPLSSRPTSDPVLSLLPCPASTPTPTLSSEFLVSEVSTLPSMWLHPLLSVPQSGDALASSTCPIPGTPALECMAVLVCESFCLGHSEWVLVMGFTLSDCSKWGHLSVWLGDNWEDGTFQKWVEPRDLKFALVAVTLGQYKARLGWP